jgi:lambda family phage portal protein
MGYWVRNAHQADVESGYESSRFTYVPRETKTGRPLFIHVFNKTRAHMHRGLGRLTSVMGRMKMLDRFDQSELQQAVINAIFGLYAKTQRSTDEVAHSMAPAGDDDEGGSYDDVRADFYAKSDLKLNGVRIAVLPEGDEIETIERQRSGNNFKVFQRVFLNSIAASLGISGEQLSNDWEGINYSNARTLLNEIWRGLLADRHSFTQSFCTPYFAAWLEEAVALDLVEIPGGKANFYLFRDALCQCDWIGPGRGWIDPKKEQEATEGRIRISVSNLPDEAAEQGNDWRQNLWEEKRVMEERKRYGLPVATAQDPQGNAGGGNDDDNDPDANDRRENEQARRAE